MVKIAASALLKLSVNGNEISTLLMPPSALSGTQFSQTLLVLKEGLKRFYISKTYGYA